MSDGPTMEAASASVLRVLQELGKADEFDNVAHVARLAWLDGYEAGHKEATTYAIQTLNRMPLGGKRS